MAMCMYGSMEECKHVGVQVCIPMRGNEGIEGAWTRRGWRYAVQVCKRVCSRYQDVKACRSAEM